jgi:hypothetical protein
MLESEPKKFLIKGIWKNRNIILSAILAILPLLSWSIYKKWWSFSPFSNLNTLYDYYLLILTIVVLLIPWVAIIIIIRRFTRGFTISISEKGVMENKRVLIKPEHLKDFEVNGTEMTIRTTMPPLKYRYNFRERIEEARKEFRKFIPEK